MNDAADVGLIDAHPEGDGGRDDGRLARHEGLLTGRPGFVAKPGVVGGGGKIVAFEKCRERFRGLLAGSVDDGGWNRGTGVALQPL